MFCKYFFSFCGKKMCRLEEIISWSSEQAAVSIAASVEVDGLDTKKRVAV